jgi:hypothetical protein
VENPEQPPRGAAGGQQLQTRGGKHPLCPGGGAGRRRHHGPQRCLILKDWPEALHVRLDGPLKQRVARAAQESGIDLERAAQRQRREDQIRADMSIELYGWDPRELDYYDLAVNTGTMDLDTCVDLIVQAARIKTGRRRAS